MKRGNIWLNSFCILSFSHRDHLSKSFWGPVAQCQLPKLDYLTAHTSLSPILRGFAPGFVNYRKECTQLAATSDKVYQLLAHGRWFSPGTPASSTTKTGSHHIAESGVKHNKSSLNHFYIINALCWKCLLQLKSDCSCFLLP